jgi:hypothetical protein
MQIDEGVFPKTSPSLTRNEPGSARFLAPGTQDYVDRLKQFHQSFMDKYRD